MPSGPKRRKAAAAKKKNETPSGSGATDSLNGLENLKEQESHGGEASSRASQDLLESDSLTQSFTEEGGHGGSSPVRQIDYEKDIVEEIVVEVFKAEEDQGSVEITRELKYDNGLESRDLSVERSHGSSNGSSSSRSSDEETIDIEKTEVVLDPVKLDEVYEVVENGVDSQVPDFVTEEVVENAVDSQASDFVAEEVVENVNAVDSQAPDFVAEEVVENAVDSQVSDFVAEGVVENAVDSQVPEFVADEVVENAVDSQIPEFITEEVLENAMDSHVAEFVPEEVAENSTSLKLPNFDADAVENAVDSPVPDFVAEEVVYVSEASPVEKDYEDLDKPVLSEAKYEMKATTDDALTAHPLPVECHGEPSTVVSLDEKDVNDKVLFPSDSPIVVTSNGAGHVKDPEIHHSIEKQTPVAHAPLSVHRTSWKDCCGLFDLFAGSR